MILEPKLMGDVRISSLSGLNYRPVIHVHTRRVRSPNRPLVDLHKHLVVTLGGVFACVLDAGFLAHEFHLGRMIPRPFHFGGQVLRVSGVEMQSRAAMLNQFFHGSQARADDRGATGKRFANGRWEVLITLAWHNYESGPLHRS